MMMYSEESVLWQIWKRRLLVFSLLLFILCATVLPIWQDIGIQPTLLLIILYHWSIYRSDLLPVEQLVLISLILDGIYAYPLGFSALRLLIGYSLLMTQRRILCHQRFHWVWTGFGIFVVIDALLFAILSSCVKHEWTGILSLIPGMLLTLGLYPIVVWILNRFFMKRLPI
jgi:rod shape-determining protein MreD